MFNYKMSVFALESEDGIEYVAEYPALKGVAGTGSTVSEAIDSLYVNAAVNIEALHEAKLPIPVEDIIAKTDEYSGKLSVRLSKNLHRKVSEFSDKEGVSINQCIVEAISSYVTYKNVEQKFEQTTKQDYYMSLINYTIRRSTYQNREDHFRYEHPNQFFNLKLSEKEEIDHAC